MPTAKAARQKVWLQRLSQQMQADVQAGADDGDMGGEIGALRVALTRVLAEVDDPAELAKAVAAITDATRKAILAQRVVSGDKAADLTDALTRVLADLGLSE